MGRCRWGVRYNGGHGGRQFQVHHQTVERYFSALRELRSLGGATAGVVDLCLPWSNLFNEIGDTLKPKVVSLQQLADTGGGHPDFGLYVKRGQQKGKKGQGQSKEQKPERGVVEVKPATDDAWLISREQIR